MKERKLPMRRCIGCMESKPKKELIRIACYEGNISLDPTGRAKGRGVYLCKKDECISKARKKHAIERNFKISTDNKQIDNIFGELEELIRYEQ